MKKLPQKRNPAGLSRRQFLHQSILAATAGTAIHSFASPNPEKRRPNVILIFPDQMRADALGCMNNPDIQTPNLDHLASQGIILQHCFANTPVCCPARACMLTGQFAHKNGMTANDLRLRESSITMAKRFRQEGYRTGFIGKWHLDGGARMPGYVPTGPRRLGFDFWAANECNHSHFDSSYFKDTPEPVAIKKFEAETWFDEASAFVQQSKDQPFFLMIAPGPPHDPYKAPPPFEAMYDPQKLTMRPNWKEGVLMGSRKDIASYYGMISAIDFQVGRFIKTLDDLGIGEDTIVFFTSDHGDMLGSQAVRLKRKPWEESIHVPGILRYPRIIPPGQKSDILISHVDFAPTLLSLCGLSIPGGMQGQNVSAQILHKGDAEPDSVFFQIFGPYEGGGILQGWRGVRTKRYMYARMQDQPWVLYDVKKDPYELCNLVTDPHSKSILADMEGKLQEWMKKSGDAWEFNWTVPVEDKGRLYKDKTYYSVKDYLDSNPFKNEQ